MTLFKCKICGGALEVGEKESVATCDYCGTRQTLPRLDGDKKANLYDRANHFRRNNDFDKAMSIYEQILNEDTTDAESYWSIVLCRYGIEYVEDPVSRKRVPTVNRAQYTSVFDDEDYKSALEYADSYQREIYEAEAEAINEIQKGILAISQKEEPFDVFICYKETDINGRRTQDSVLAQELYYGLKNEGFKVFFSRITLEDKLGTEYEPYIFAALNSSKVMVALGTKVEHFNSVWVKNEWSRYLALIRNGAKKTLIPAYRDIDPYDLPEEFSHLQAQDMSKLGFMQDLIRGIKKIVSASEPSPTVVKETVVSVSDTRVSPLLERASMFLEDEDWANANRYYEKVLDLDPKNAYAYVGNLMATLHVKKQEQLKDCEQPFDGNNYYQKAIRFADDELKATLEGYIEHINTRVENERIEGIYDMATAAMQNAHSEQEYKDAAYIFKRIHPYKDSEELTEKCFELAEEARKDRILLDAKTKMAVRNISSLEKTIEIFKEISGFKDADEQIVECQKIIEDIKAEEEAERLEQERQAELARIRAKRNKKIIAALTSFVCVAIAFVLVFNFIIVPNDKYYDAIRLMENGKWNDARNIFAKLDGYRDSEEKIKECDEGLLNEEYESAKALIEEGRFIEAYLAFISLGEYKDSAEIAESIRFQYYIEAIKNKTVSVGDYIYLGSYEQDNDTSNGAEDIEWLVLEVKDGRALLVSKYAIECKSYHSTPVAVDVTWESCSLRTWLNNDFFSSSFSDEEKEIIATATVPSDINNTYFTDGGNYTLDKVFLLSMTEARNYFYDDAARKCQATPYVCANGASLSRKDSYCYWWLRTPGHSQHNATYIDDYGKTNMSGDAVNSKVYAVRPALWVELNSEA
ncbi:MAG: TIR domain-containing protein [Clostridia bacterium]|nr:TIR domain-containing protein [Clostridia bacterium]